jgi:phosphoribosyl 1,2-cyclic phosphodiesterase
MRVISLGSGSSGNALLVEAGPQGRTRLLVDAGFGGRDLVERLKRAGVSPSQITGILLTHEHSDHILGIPFLQKRYRVPLIANELTLTAVEIALAEELARKNKFASHDALLLHRAESDSGPLIDGIEVSPGDVAAVERFSIAMPVGSSRRIGDIEVRSFAVSHDAVSPCGYLLSAGGCRVCVAIDSGEVTDTMLEAIAQADLLVLESNHDRERLLRGPYPYHLKQRILSATGHLSNAQAAEAVLRTWRSDSVRWLWLSHLSRTNNTPRLALETMRASIEAAKGNLAHIHISTLPPGIGSEWDSTQLWHSASLWEMHG